MYTKKLIDYYKSCPVQCKTGVYADSTDGTRLYYDAESEAFKPDTRSGKKTKVKKKLMRPLYSYRVSFEDGDVVTDIYCVEEINKHGLKWNCQPVYHSVYHTKSCTYAENGNGHAAKWFAANKDFDVAELIAEQYNADKEEQFELFMELNIAVFIGQMPFGKKVREEFSEISYHAFLTYLYSGAYHKLCDREKDPTKFRFGIELEFTGIARGSAANVIAKQLGTEKKYVGGGYHRHIVKDSAGREWTVMRDASILPVPEHSNTPLDYYRCELVTPICTAEDIPTISKIINALRHRGMKVNASCGLHIHVDVQAMNERHILNLVNLMACKEDLLFKALNVSSSRRNRWCKGVDERFLSEINSSKIISINDLKRIWYGSHNYDSYLRYHDSRYHALNLHSLWQNKGVEFRMFNSTVDEKEVKAYIYLVLAMCQHATMLKRAAYTSRSKADGKAQFRSWLQQIGLNGKKFKSVREELMKNFKSERTERRRVA